MDIHTLANLGRFKEIILILMKYGFDDLIDRLEIPGAKLLKKIYTSEKEMGTAERVRHALEDMGPTFVKFGQIMSLRPDLLPQSFIEELSKLQDEVAPVEMTKIREVVEKNTGKPIQETFSNFDETPLAAASLSQVHRAVLKKDGRVAAVKVQRPDIRSKIKTDLDILAAVAGKLDERVEDLKAYDLPNLVRVIKRMLLRELDFKREARNMKIARSYADEKSGVYIPEVYEDHCTEQLLVMEYVLGTSLKDFRTEALASPEALARKGLHFAVKQILRDGFFHADPHPGNILITEEENICLLDWGMAGRLSERDRHELIDLLKSVVDKDGEAMVQALLRVSRSDVSMDQRSLERELLDILDFYYSMPIKEIDIGRLLLTITELLRTYDLRLPSDLVIMIKALVTAEGTARYLYPDLDIISEAREYITDLARQRYRPASMLHSLRLSLFHFLRLQQEVPRHIEMIMTKAEKGQLTIGFRHENLSELMKTLDNVSNRLTFGVIIAAMIIGSSMIITTGIGPLLFGFPALGIVGYTISGVLGLWLVYNILRWRKF